MQIEVHPLTNNPTAAWEELSPNQNVMKIKASPPKDKVDVDKIRVVCMSDTHSLTSNINFHIPKGDIFIHAGDFTKFGGLSEVLAFNSWIGSLPHKNKIVIAGNHELSFDDTLRSRNKKIFDQMIFNPRLGLHVDDIIKAVKTQNIKACLTNCVYLEDEAISIYGLNIYGTPWQPEFCKWAFNLPRGEACLKKWDDIPDNTDILVTHTPPIGHGDLCCSGVRAGCVELLSTVQQRVKPKYHIFGHIHEGYGMTSDGQTIYVNASTCDINYLPVNPPIVFDISLP